MTLRTRLNLVIAGLAAVFLALLISYEVQAARATLREELEAAHTATAQALAQVASLPGGGPAVLPLLRRLGHVRGNDIQLLDAKGGVLYRSPAAIYKAGRAAPRWFENLMAPAALRHEFQLGDGSRIVVMGESSRAALEAWDRILWLSLIAAPVFLLAIGIAFHGMAQVVRDSVRTERKAREAEARLAERRELALIVDQRIEEERRLIAHELHDEFGQSVTAIRSCAQAIVQQSAQAGMREAAQLISDEAGRLYDAMHGLIPRLLPVALDPLDLAGTLEGLVGDWQKRYPAVKLSLQHELPAPLGPSVTLAACRVVQEGLLNALRHAQASRIEVQVASDATRLALSITDDGAGLPADWSRPGNFGLRGLAGRIDHLGGTFSVANHAPHGVRLTAQIPLAADLKGGA